MGVRFNTIHHYVKALHRHFGVSTAQRTARAVGGPVTERSHAGGIPAPPPRASPDPVQRRTSSSSGKRSDVRRATRRPLSRRSASNRVLQRPPGRVVPHMPCTPPPGGVETSRGTAPWPACGTGCGSARAGRTPGGGLRAAGDVAADRLGL
jgi:hypothetical protein